MKKPTKKEVDKNVAWLEANIDKLPRANMFGDNLQDHARADLKVLTENLSQDDIDDRTRFEDEDEDDSKDWDQNQRDSATSVREWLDGNESTSPISNYEHLVKKT